MNTLAQSIGHRSAGLSAFHRLGRHFALGLVLLGTFVAAFDGPPAARGAAPSDSHGAAPAEAGHADEGQSQKPKLLEWDFGSAFWSIIVFVLLLTVLRSVAWKPILNAMQKREDFIRDSLAEAKRNRDESEARLREYTEKLNAARVEASGIVEEGRRDADVLRRKIEDTAKAEASAMIERARREIGVATETAVKELYSVSAKLATSAASKIIQKELDATQHDRLIRESIDELTRATGRGNGAPVAGRR